MRRLGTTSVALVLALAGAPAANAATLAPVPANVPISAAGGWVAWSVPAVGGWQLLAWHGGALAPLPIPSRPQPFDVDLGTDAGGRVVATFSRCASTPVLDDFGKVEPWTGAGCRIRVVDLASGVERALDVPHPRGTSDTTPSMWGGRVAFARADRHHNPNVSQVLLWSPRSHRLTTLIHGATPPLCRRTRRCLDELGRQAQAAVEGLDLGARIVTFLWYGTGPGVVGHAGWEVRADRLSDGRGFLAGRGVVGEACAGTIDVPSTPAADGDVAWYTELDLSCPPGVPYLASYDTRARSLASGAFSGQILQFAKDGSTLYALVAPTPATEDQPTCNAPGAPCTIQTFTAPPLTPQHALSPLFH